jgi:hypothetical protein
MTKVEELIQELEYHMDQEGEYHLNCEGHRLIDELIQAVRDEEFEKHAAASQSSSCCNMVCYDDCPAKGTRYCP